MSATGPDGAHLHHHPPGSLQRAAVRFGILVAILVGAFVAVRFTPLRDLLTIEHLPALLADLRGAWWSPFALVGLCLVFGTIGVPATPFLIAGAAIFGAFWGTVWNFLGILAASMAGYGLARLLGREFVERIGGARMRRAEKLLHRRGFLPLVAIRFLPIPFTLVNAAAAVVGVRFGRFLLASAVGMLPPIAIITYFTVSLLEAAAGDRAAIGFRMLVVSASAATLVFLPIGIRRRLRRRRLGQLRKARAARPSRDRRS